LENSGLRKQRDTVDKRANRQFCELVLVQIKTVEAKRALGLYYFLSLRNGKVEIRVMSLEDVLLDALCVLL